MQLISTLLEVSSAAGERGEVDLPIASRNRSSAGVLRETRGLGCEALVNHALVSTLLAPFRLPRRKGWLSIWEDGNGRTHSARWEIAQLGNRSTGQACGENESGSLHREGRNK